MAAITLEKFRLVSQLNDAALPREQAIQALIAGSGVARQVTGREFGHAIEFAEQIPTTDNVAITIFAHHLPESGTVYVRGTGVVALEGLLAYDVLDVNSIMISDVTLAEKVIQKGVVCVPCTKQARVVEGVAVLEPGPVAKVTEVRLRSADYGNGDGPFPDGSIIDSSRWYIDTTSGPSWNGEIEIYGNSTVYKRVPGMINPVKQKARRESLTTFYSGCFLGLPDELAVAIASIAKEIAQDPSGSFQSENYDYYSYQRMDPSLVSKLPTSAIATLYSYRLGR